MTTTTVNPTETRDLDADMAICEADLKPIPKFPGYLVSRDGRVYSVSSNWRGYGPRELVQSPNSHGYMRVRVGSNGTRAVLMVHKLVAELFLPLPESPDLQIRHLDGKKYNNSAQNLKWGTAKENADDRERHGNTCRGSVNGFSRLNEIEVGEIKRMLSQGIPQRVIAHRFDVSQRTICRINKGVLWKHVG